MIEWPMSSLHSSCDAFEGKILGIHVEKLDLLIKKLDFWRKKSIICSEKSNFWLKTKPATTFIAYRRISAAYRRIPASMQRYAAQCGSTRRYAINVLPSYHIHRIPIQLHSQNEPIFPLVLHITLFWNQYISWITF